MNSDSPAPEDGDTEHREDVSVEERLKSPPRAGNILGAPVPVKGFDFSNILDQNRFSKIFAARDLVAPFKLPESTLNRFAELITGADRFSKLTDTIKSAIQQQDRWSNQFTRLNSDWFNNQAVSQAQFAKLSAGLTQNFDFGASDRVAKLMQQFAAQQESWLTKLDSSFDLFKRAFYPPNLREIEGIEFEDVEKIVMADAIALYGVPRTSIAEALISAESAAKRREILGRRWSAISADCREVVNGLSTDAVALYTSSALAALDALDNKHTEAAQALTGSLIDSLLWKYFGKDRFKYTPDKKGKRTTEAYEKFSAHEFITFAPMWQVYQQFWVEEGDRVPNTFSRNATAHTVSPRQYNRRNAIQALLFATSLLYFLDQQSLILDARRRRATSQQSDR